MPLAEMLTSTGWVVLGAWLGTGRIFEEATARRGCTCDAQMVASPGRHRVLDLRHDLGRPWHFFARCLGSDTPGRDRPPFEASAVGICDNQLVVAVDDRADMVGDDGQHRAYGRPIG